MFKELPQDYRIVLRNCIVALSLLLFSLLLLPGGYAQEEIMVLWGILLPFSIVFYTWLYYSLIPLAYSKKKPLRAFIPRVFWALTLSFIPLGFLITLYLKAEDDGFSYALFNCFLQLCITTPVCWQLYKRSRKGKEDVVVLQKELGQSNASFDFLRSQINPHFLFNALNTIYGTALQEKAERTSEGIEKLGDMMRFMLQENIQEKISLVREIDYLNNYITLQKLRTDINPGIRIETLIAPPLHTIEIAPMLLIPFVENAFKHGISFREPSHIKVNLEMKENTLYFDVYNSRHTRPESDPEKDHTGIGLENVKQRLKLLYPMKHELIIRETGKEFFVHLTIELS
jgi:two-component system, LytTR family, sensor kinase